MARPAEPRQARGLVGAFERYPCLVSAQRHRQWRRPLDERLIGRIAYTSHLMQRSEGWRYALLGVWERFDTLWYPHIAHRGYDNPTGAVFYPLYPLLIRALQPIFRDPLITALAIATVATFFLF